jgi:glyoxylase-like metal-dependent hydrolase (beta-lactamase superfamily II)
MGYYTMKKIYPWLYSLADPANVFCYLLVGDDRALLYDTAYGIGDLTEAIREVTALPVDVVLGHGHIDHANGAYQFESVWLHEDDFALCHLHTSEVFRKMNINEDNLPDGFDKDAYIHAKTENLKALPVGRVFDLGGLRVETVAMEGHTAGSVGLLAREHRVLLTSDAANPHIWMFLKESLLLRDYIAMLKRVRQLEFDTFFVGHNDEPLPKSDMEKYISAAENASLEKAEPYGVMTDLNGYVYKEGDTAIVFSERTLKGENL